jgi:hypothetical protein
MQASLPHCGMIWSRCYPFATTQLNELSTEITENYGKGLDACVNELPSDMNLLIANAAYRWRVTAIVDGVEGPASIEATAT